MLHPMKSSTQLNGLQRSLLFLIVRHLVPYDVERRCKQQRNFGAAAHHQRGVVHLHAVINPHAGRNNAQKTEQQRQAVGALVLVQQKHEYESP